MEKKIKSLINSSIETKKKVMDDLTLDIERAANIIIGSLKKGNKLLICGNGGSCADAQHFAAELIIRFEQERRAIPAIALTANTSNITACANDYGYDRVFSRQVEALGKKDDVLFGITTSGNSKNIIEAFNAAKNSGLKTICLNGKDGGKINQFILDSNIVVRSDSTARIQESHIMIIHILCRLIDDSFTGEN